MKQSEFNLILRDVQLKLLKNGNKIYFEDDDFETEQFINWIDEDLKSRGDYRSNSIFTYDVEDFSLSLNQNLNNLIFLNNTIVNTVLNSDYAKFEELSILFMYKMLNSLIVPQFKASRDEGIDFYGKFISSDDSDSHLFDVNTWYIGQTKYFAFDRKIKTNYIRELIGTLELARIGKWSIEGNYRDINIEYSDNIMPVFITSSSYSKDSKKLAKHYGVILLDIIDMIFWLTIVFEGNEQDMLFELKDLKQNSRKKLSSYINS